MKIYMCFWVYLAEYLSQNLLFIHVLFIIKIKRQEIDIHLQSTGRTTAQDENEEIGEYETTICTNHCLQLTGHFLYQ
jgi:hypothetical protein